MSFSVAKVQRKSTEIEAADLLRHAIVCGDVPLGERLTEVALAKQLGVSRTTVRTVLHQLVQEGLVNQVPYVGWSVMTLSPRDAWELYTLRSSLETLAAKLVADSVNNSGMARIKDVLDASLAGLEQACEEGSQAAIAAADMALHRACVDLSDHGRLRSQYDQIQHQVQIYIRSSDGLIQEPALIFEQHKPLVAALLSGDPVAAQAAFATHLGSEGAILESHLAASTTPV